MIEIKNKKAFFDYSILEELEAGIALSGTEIKSIRKGSVDLKVLFINSTFHLILLTHHYMKKLCF